LAAEARIGRPVFSLDLPDELVTLFLHETQHTYLLATRETSHERRPNRTAGLPQGVLARRRADGRTTGLTLLDLPVEPEKGCPS